MTRFIRLSCGGEIAIHNVEHCPECGANARQVRSEGAADDPDAFYYCTMCNAEWAMVHDP